jgi:hypothetical protein
MAGAYSVCHDTDAPPPSPHPRQNNDDSSEPLEVALVLIAGLTTHDYTMTNLLFMKAVLNDFNRRKRALQLCVPMRTHPPCQALARRLNYDALMMRRARHLLATAPQ